MSKRKKKRNKLLFNLKKEFNNEICGIFSIAFGLIILTGLQTNSAGKIGKGFKFILMGLFSNSAFLLPYIIIFLGIMVFIGKNFESQKKKILYFSCVFIYLLTFKSLLDFQTNAIFINKLLKDGLTVSFKTIFLRSTEGVGGGLIGTSIAYILLKLFGPIASYIIIVTLFLITTILITKISLLDILIKIKSLLSKFIISFKDFFITTNNRLLKDNEDLVKNLDDDSIDDIFDKNHSIVDEKIKILDYTGINTSEKNNNIKTEVTDISPKNTKDEKNDLESEEDLIYFDINTNNQNDDIVYELPSIELLHKPESLPNKEDKKSILSKAKILENTLKNFGVEAKVLQVTKGPSVTRYELQPSTGVKVSKIVNLSDDIALNLAAVAIRIEAPIPGKAAIGIEIPNEKVTIVTLREIIESENYQSFSSSLPFAIGKDVSGNTIVGDISKMPHLLIAGATGSGKSVCINTLILSILYKSTPEEVRLILIDPKVVELSQYNGIPHLLIPVVNDSKKATSALNWAVQEMENRYKIFGENKVKDISGYNNKVPENKLPHIVIIIDELADLMMTNANEVEDAICRLAQMARAAGIHLIIATQRPSVDIITGVIKANIPSRIAFSVAAQTDSRTILDMGGAEKLLGKGDMLYYPMGANKPMRVQGAFVSEKEVEDIVNYIKNQVQDPNYVTEVVEKIEHNTIIENDNDTDELFNDALQIVAENQQASISMLQRRLRIGYNRAARIIDEMEARGIVGPHEGSKPRQLLIDIEDLNNENIS